MNIRICTHADVSITVWRSGRGGDNVEVTLHQIDRGLVTASSNGYCPALGVSKCTTSLSPSRGSKYLLIVS